MDLEKQYIHKNILEGSAQAQLSLEKDYTLPDNAENIQRILLTQTEIIKEVVEPGEHQLLIKGYLQVNFLYQPDLGAKDLCSSHFKIPFEETIKMEELSPASHPEVTLELEKNCLSFINSRKVSFRCNLNISCLLSEINSQEIVSGFQNPTEAESRLSKKHCLSLCCMKNDMFRIREELKLSTNVEAIHSILWSDIKIRSFEVHPMHEQLNIRGEICAFFIYLGDDDEYHFKDGCIPFHGVLECDGCVENGIVNLACIMERKECSIRPDDDGEDRIIGIDINLSLSILIYEEKEVPCLEDAYSYTSNLTLNKTEVQCLKPLYNDKEQFRVDQTLPMPSTVENIDTILFSTFEPEIQRVVKADASLVLSGNLMVSLLYTVKDDRYPFRAATFPVAFTHEINVPGLTEQTDYQIQASYENLSVSPFDSETLQIKAVVGISVFTNCTSSFETVTEVTQSPLSSQELKKYAKISVFYPDKSGNLLWDIGKETKVPLSRIRQLNDLEENAEYYKTPIIVMK